MKKIFAFVAAAMCCTMMMGASSSVTYTCHLKVVINGNPTEQEEVPVLVTNDNGKYSMYLNNFVLWTDGFPMPVGNITITDVEGVVAHGYTTIKYKGDIDITAGDSSVSSSWVGPLLSPVPVDIVTRFTDTAAEANIFIDLASMNQKIDVSAFGVAPASEGVKGDVNNDGEVNISDVNTIIDIILSD